MTPSQREPWYDELPVTEDVQMNTSMDEYYRNFVRWLNEEFIPTVTKHSAAPQAPKGVYGEWCRKPEACAGKGYCPLDPNCGD